MVPGQKKGLLKNPHLEIEERNRKARLPKERVCIPEINPKRTKEEKSQQKSKRTQKT